MMKSSFKMILSIALVITLLAACSTTVTQNEKNSESPDEQVKVNHKIEDEPMYGKTIQVGYNGGLCTSAPGVAKAMGYFEEEGIDVEIVSAKRR